MSDSTSRLPSLGPASTSTSRASSRLRETLCSANVPGAGATTLGTALSPMPSAASLSTTSAHAGLTAPLRSICGVVAIHCSPPAPRLLPTDEGPGSLASELARAVLAPYTGAVVRSPPWPSPFACEQPHRLARGKHDTRRAHGRTSSSASREDAADSQEDDRTPPLPAAVLSVSVRASSGLHERAATRYDDLFVLEDDAMSDSGDSALAVAASERNGRGSGRRNQACPGSTASARPALGESWSSTSSAAGLDCVKLRQSSRDSITPAQSPRPAHAAPHQQQRDVAGTSLAPCEMLHPVGSGAFATAWLVRLATGSPEADAARAASSLSATPTPDASVLAVMKVPCTTHSSGDEERAEKTAIAARREATLLSALQHPHIVRFLGKTDRGPALNTGAFFLEFCGQGDLHGIVRRFAAPGAPFRTVAEQQHDTGARAVGGGLDDVTDATAAAQLTSTPFPVGFGLPEELVWIVIAHVGEALRYLHYEAGVVHRDVKPKNLLVADDGCVKLCDFGVAAHVGLPFCDRRRRFVVIPQHEEAPFNGTVNYAAPELLDQAPFDGRADVWALGCTAFEMMSGGTRAFPGRSIAEVIGRVCCGARPKLTPEATGGYSATLCSLVEAMLAPDAAARPTSAQVLDALGERGKNRALDASFVETFNLRCGGNSTVARNHVPSKDDSSCDASNTPGACSSAHLAPHSPQAQARHHHPRRASLDSPRTLVADGDGDTPGRDATPDTHGQRRGNAISSSGLRAFTAPRCSGNLTSPCAQLAHSCTGPSAASHNGANDASDASLLIPLA